MSDYTKFAIKQEEGLAVGFYVEDKRILQFISWEGAGKFVDRIFEANREDKRIYKIWRSGWSGTGNPSEPAQYIGKIEANSFQEACDKLIPTTKFAEDYNPYSRSVWACGLYDNEEDARRSFG